MDSMVLSVSPAKDQGKLTVASLSFGRYGCTCRQKPRN
ncbi:hypothetical protein M6B38_120645 [Iris pallida]|uniref:Uncharacterized protein n=1 Tax=Iris pallida TaxID=29817 RepID=A0AAX6GFM9_IRIPA|nr:hypothetical protein M6B38_126545 [Iris pallida]KAJ6837400.1 hypothetical protein M6B38_120645 [Iris pallida]